MTDADDQSPLPPRLIFSEVHPGHVEVFIEPPWRRDWATFADRSPTDPRPSGSLLSYDATRSTLFIRPLVTNLSMRFLEPKHGPIIELVFEDFRASLPKTEQDVRGLLQGLPTGFITSFEFGLGVEKEYLPILEAVCRVRGVTCLVLTHSHKTGPNESLFYLTYDDYDDVRRAIHRVTRRYRAEARIDRKILAHNEILTALDPVNYPEAKRTYAPGTVFKLLSRRGEASKLSRDDGKALIKTLKAATPRLAQDAEQLFALGQEVERVSLEMMLQRFEALLTKAGSEAQWQSLLDQNPFILSLVFGYPIVRLARQGAVGGWRLSGGGGKVADYVVKNQLTRSIALVELKTPKTDLVVGDYRKGVPGISAKLTGAVMQVLDQRLKLHKSLPLLQSEDPDLRSAEAYGIDCIVIAGMTPTEPAAMKSFELFRSGLRDVRIFTFDELAAKMRALLDVLAGEADPGMT